MGLARRVMRRLVDFYRELDRGLAVMRGEETVAGHTPGIDWTRKRGRGAASDRRCRRSVLRDERCDKQYPRAVASRIGDDRGYLRVGPFCLRAVLARAA